MTNVDPDIAAMAEAYRQLMAIPVQSNRRAAALWWIYTRVKQETLLEEATTRTVRVRTVEPMPPITLDDSDLPMEDDNGT